MTDRPRKSAAADFEYKPSFVRGARRFQHECARGLLRDLLAEMGISSLKDLKVTREESGRPVATGLSEPVDISIAHSGQWIACGAATAGRIGIDVEAAKPRPNAARIASAYFGPAEQRLVAERGEAAFLALWTIREAFGKATGKGMEAALSLTDEQVVPAHEGVHLLARSGWEWAIGHRCLGAAHLALAWSVPDPDRLGQALDEAYRRATAQVT